MKEIAGRADDTQKNVGLLAAKRLEPSSERFSAVRNLFGRAQSIGDLYSAALRMVCDFYGLP